MLDLMVYLCPCKAPCRLNLVEPFAENVLVIEFSRLDRQWSLRAPDKENYGNRWDESANQIALGTLLE